MKQKNSAHQGHDYELFYQLIAKIVDSPLYQSRPVIDRNNLYAIGQALLHAGQFCFHRLNRFQRVLARAHDDHAANGFTLTIELAYAAAHFWAELNSRHIG